MALLVSVDLSKLLLSYRMNNADLLLQEENLLLCDACDLGYHLECCVPALESVPRGRWYCPTCSMAGSLAIQLTIR